MITKQDRLNLVHALVFENKTDLADILNPNKTHDNLIHLLIELVNKKYVLGITCVNTLHHDDSSLGEHCHRNCWAIDLWPMNSHKAGDWMDASTHNFRQFLKDVAACKFYCQTGLVGDGADSPENFLAAGPKAFQDDGGAHVHISAQEK